MKIIGSGKIDDFKKVVLDTKVLRSLNVKPGDSVLFYRGDENGSVCMFRAEGAQVTDECDSPARNHMREGPQKIRLALLGCAAMLVVLMVIIALYFRDSATGTAFFVTLGVWLVALIAIFIAIFVAFKLDEPTESQTFVTIGGPYSKNRLTGLSKLLSDGYVVSGNIYINSLFGTNPDNVEVRMEYSNGVTDVALTKCIKSVSGYSVYRIRCMSENITSGRMVVVINYPYQSKRIVLESIYDLTVKEGSSQIKIKESDVKATIEFDQTFNEAVFDEALFDPTDDEMIY